MSIIVAENTARTATEAFTFSHSGVGGTFVIDVTSVTASPSVVFTVRGQGQDSATTWDILASAAVTATGVTRLVIHPSLTASANAIAKDILPNHVVVNAAHADTDSISYSIVFHPV